MSRLQSLLVTLCSLCLFFATGCHKTIRVQSLLTGPEYKAGNVLLWKAHTQGTSFTVFVERGHCKEGGTPTNRPANTDIVTAKDKDGNFKCTLLTPTTEAETILYYYVAFGDVQLSGAKGADDEPTGYAAHVGTCRSPCPGTRFTMKSAKKSSKLSTSQPSGLLIQHANPPLYFTVNCPAGSATGTVLPQKKDVNNGQTLLWDAGQNSFKTDLAICTGAGLNKPCTVNGGVSGQTYQYAVSVPPQGGCIAHGEITVY